MKIIVLSDVKKTKPYPKLMLSENTGNIYLCNNSIQSVLIYTKHKQYIDAIGKDFAITPAHLIDFDGEISLSNE